jgi:hypothetical protein
MEKNENNKYDITLELRTSIRTTAITMMENADYMLKEIPRVEFSGSMGEKIREASENMIGTKHDVFNALHDLDELIEEKDATDRIRDHFSMILGWIREDIKAMHGLTGEIYATALKDNRFHLGFTLVVESAVNIITTANPCFKTFNELNIAA